MEVGIKLTCAHNLPTLEIQRMKRFENLPPRLHVHASAFMHTQTSSLESKPSFMHVAPALHLTTQSLTG